MQFLALLCNLNLQINILLLAARLQKGQKICIGFEDTKKKISQQVRAELVSSFCIILVFRFCVHRCFNFN